MGWLVVGLVAYVSGIVTGWWLRGVKPLPDVEPNSAKQSMAEKHRNPPKTTGRG